MVLSAVRLVRLDLPLQVLINVKRLIALLPSVLHVMELALVLDAAVVILFHQISLPVMLSVLTQIATIVFLLRSVEGA